LNAGVSSPSKTQQWFRNYAEGLMASFKSSGLLEHRVTKGESRERQIFGILDKLLPTLLFLKQDVVIVDSWDAESPKFDGVLFDRKFWPLLFQESNIAVAMVESVYAAFEIKSSLGTSELQDIFSKAQKLRSMKCIPGSLTSPPLVTAFAYQCPNSKLAYFDFAVNSQRFPNFTPSLICILNQALFGLIRKEGTTPSLIDQPSVGHIPVIFQTQEDTLLIYIYLLSRWATAGTDSVDTFMKYSEKVFSGLKGFHFDADFLDSVTSDPSALNKARTCFEGNSNKNIKDAYVIARGQIGLS